MLQRIVLYLEKIGYSIEETGSLAKFLVIFRDGVPMGFILPDLTVSLVEKENEDLLNLLVTFIRSNDGLDLVAGSEYLLSHYGSHKLTTYFDIESKQAKYACYIASDGEVSHTVFDSPHDAGIQFAVLSGLVDPSALRNNGNCSFRDKLISKIIHYLSSKKTNKARS